MSGKAAGKKGKRNAGATTAAAAGPVPAVESDQGPEAKRPKGKATRKDDATAAAAEVASSEEEEEEGETSPAESTEATKTQEKRPRGRPKGAMNKPSKETTEEYNSVDKRSRGRPKKMLEKAAPEKTGVKKGRGRPPKKSKAETSSESEDEES